jgi:hypothetical protein
MEKVNCYYCKCKKEQVFKFNSNNIYINVCKDCLDNLQCCDICNSDVNKLKLYANPCVMKNDLIILVCDICAHKLDLQNIIQRI